MNTNLTDLKNCLHNLSLFENNNRNLTQEQKGYYRGLIVGIVTALMSKGHSFHIACQIVVDCLPEYHVSMLDILPLTWVDEFKSLMNGGF